MNIFIRSLKRLSGFIAVLTVWNIVLSCNGCTRNHEASDIDKISEECWRLTRNNTDFDRSDSLARILLDYGRRTGDRAVEAKALYYLGVYDHQPANAEKRHVNLQKCLDMLSPGRDDTLLLKVYNAMGIYEVAHYRRYSQGAHYFTKSMELARALGDEPKAIVAEQNLSAIMIFTGDTLGIKYDEDIFRYAKQIGDTALLYRSASHCGIYYSRQKFDEKKARAFAEIVKGTSCNVNYNKIMAYIALNKKDYQESERQLKHVLRYRPYDATALLNYSDLLNLTKRWELSNRYAERADSMFSKAGSFGPVSETARIRVSNYASLGDMSKAYYWETVYANRLDSLSKIKQKETVTSARISFDTAKKEHTIELQEIKMKGLYMWILFIFILAVMIITGMVLYVRRRNRRYKQIVERSRLTASQDIALRELLNSRDSEILELRQELDTIKPDHTPDQLPEEDTPPHDEDNVVKKENPCEARQTLYDTIFSKILHEVIDRQGYRDTAITRDVLSERVGCSHTYLTEAIKHKTGLSYSRYMNSVRVNEAVSLLTKGTDMSLEELSKYVGFLSVKTFYVAFKEFIGVSPGKFRELASET